MIPATVNRFAEEKLWDQAASNPNPDASSYCRMALASWVTSLSVLLKISSIIPSSHCRARWLKARALEIAFSGLNPWFCHLLAVWSWVFISLSVLQFPSLYNSDGVTCIMGLVWALCKIMGVINKNFFRKIPSSPVMVQFQTQCPAHTKTLSE